MESVKYALGKNPNSHIKGLFQKGHKFLKGGEKGWFKKGSKINVGRKMSEKVKEALRIANMNKIYSEETRRKLKLNASKYGFQKGHELTKGEKSPTWKGGLSFEPYGLGFNKELKEQIRQRDNFRCQQCFRHQDELFRIVKGEKIRNCKLDIHHIDFNKKNNNTENLISLCRNCHAQTSFKREDWTNYFEKKVGGK